MASVPANKESATKKRSLVIMDMPEEFINRDILKHHFEQYGTVERLACSISKKYAIIHFSNADEAENALKNGTKIQADAPPLKIYYSAKAETASSQRPKTALSSSSGDSNRLVTRRKIVRNVVKPRTSIKSSGESSAKIEDKPSPSPSNTFEDVSEPPSAVASVPPASHELLAKRATTVEERYRILEARDKIMRSKIPKTKVNVEFATKLTGTCPDMCPEKERYMRQFQRQLVIYECLPGPDIAVDHQRAIKAYSRSSADQEEPLPHELRPGPTLDFTMNYLLQAIVPLGDDPDENLSDWYNFLWDRTRSIRKDITQQQIIDLTAVSLFEKCTRLHIHCSSRLCQLDMHSFDPKLNDENLMKCLQSLEYLYEDLRRRGVTCPNEPEFRAYQIMMKLNEGDALYYAQQLPNWILNSLEVQTALKLHLGVSAKNFVAFFQTVERLPYMMSCILHRYFFQVRSLALRCLVKAYCTLPKYETAISLSTLQRMLGYGPDEVQSFIYLCEAHGIHCDADENKVILKRKLFYLPESPSIYRESHLIDSKLQTSVSEAINGGPLPDIDFASRKPHSSFNENGHLISVDIIGTQENKTVKSFPASSQSDDGVTVISAPTKAALAPSMFSQNPFTKPRTEASTFSMFRPTEGGTGAFGIKSNIPSFAMFKSDSSAIGTLPKATSFGQSSFPLVAASPIQEKRKITLMERTREIEAVCQTATSTLIDDTINQNITRISQATLEEERRIKQEAIARRKLQEQICTKLSMEWVEKAATQHTVDTVRSQGAARLRQLREVESVSKNTVAEMVEESVLMNISISARTELVIAKEYHHRLMMNLTKIFARLRTRFALEKWKRFVEVKRVEREMQEEKRREELWNFPCIDSYSSSTKDVLNALCGKNTVQPSLNKINCIKDGDCLLDKILQKSPETVRMKRKSGGDTVESSITIPSKFPRISTVSNGGPQAHHLTEQKLKELWEFPTVDPYNRTNKQVFEAFCGSSSVINLPVSPKMTVFLNIRREDTYSSIPSSDNIQSIGSSSNSPFNIHRPGTYTSNDKIGEEIKTKAYGTTTDLLKNIQSFISEVREESVKSICLKPFEEDIDLLRKTCPELSNIDQPFHVHCPSGIYEDTEGDSDMEMDLQPPSNIHTYPIFGENNDLLNSIKRFTRQVREENAKSWNANTFLNDIDLDIIS